MKTIPMRWVKIPNSSAWTLQIHEHGEWVHMVQDTCSVMLHPTPEGYLIEGGRWDGLAVPYDTPFDKSI